MKIPRRVRRVGCGLLLVLWFLFLLTPCLVIVLVTDQEIVLPHSDVPNDDARIWMIQSVEARGVGLSNAHRVNVQNDTACVVTDVHFLIWSGKGSDSAHVCSCYQKQNNQWESVAEAADACKLAGE